MSQERLLAALDHLNKTGQLESNVRHPASAAHNAERGLRISLGVDLGSLL